MNDEYSHTEIERKFLVKDTSFKEHNLGTQHIVQGYLSRDPQRIVRIRIIDEAQAYITIKGAGKLSRYEWEMKIPLVTGQELLKMALPGIIEKVRWFVPAQERPLLWEIDEFLLPKKLLLAEIELPSKTTSITLPDFIGEEVTGKKEYYNSNM